MGQESDMIHSAGLDAKPCPTIPCGQARTPPNGFKLGGRTVSSEAGKEQDAVVRGVDTLSLGRKR
jgi:hypothetical protein